MLRVKIYHLVDGEDEVAGELVERESTVVPEPKDSILLRNILRDLPPGKDVKAYLRGLHKQIHGAYVRAGKAEERP